VKELSAESHTASVSTWKLLQSLGFVADGKGLRFEFGNFTLEAIEGMSQGFRPVVSVDGVLSTGRTISLVDGELPTEMESREHGLALIAFILRGEPLSYRPAWLSEGDSYGHLLPWERQRKVCEERPHCSVQRDWMRLALKTLATQLAALEDDAPLLFCFREGIMRIHCPRAVIAMPAEGRSWSQSYSVTAGSLRRLPKRLTQCGVEISIWDSSLQIANMQYNGARAIEIEKSSDLNT
jgi:hypothetical protein